MNTKITYLEMKKKDVDCHAHRCFFAFNNEQFKAGMEKAGIGENETICSAGAGLYGVREGITSFFEAHKLLRKGIAKVCDPQEVYDYEFDNYECEWTGDDTEAMRVVVVHFGEERAKEVQRRCACCEIEELFAEA